jgi:pyruvate decarboxylase
LYVGLPPQCGERISRRFLTVSPSFATPAPQDYVEDHPTIEWVGCTNELNASYAADGYARMKRGLGVLVTTFGVGELSATNGIAGSFSEHVPVLHIVGVPSTGLQSKGALLHHTLGDGRFDAFQNIYSNITVTQAHIQPASRKFGTSTAGEEIDRAIFQALKTNRPTYLTLPTDLVDALIPAEPLRTSVTHSSIDRLLSEPGVSAEVEQHIIAKICKMYERAQRPCVLVDAGVVRFHMQDATKELIEKTGMTFFSSPMGKAAMDENSAQFGGNYVGSITMPGVKEAFENADFVLSLGRCVFHCRDPLSVRYRG